MNILINKNTIDLIISNTRSKFLLVTLWNQHFINGESFYYIAQKSYIGSRKMIADVCYYFVIDFMKSKNFVNIILEKPIYAMIRFDFGKISEQQYYKHKNYFIRLSKMEDGNKISDDNYIIHWIFLIEDQYLRLTG